MKNKKGQQAVGMSFGMIFAIFLIVVFVVFAFIAIRFFLDMGDKTGVGEFYIDLQDSVDRSIQGQSSDKSFDVNLPSNIEKICFGNLSAPITNDPDYQIIKYYDDGSSNVFLVPPEKAQNLESKKIKSIDIANITSEDNPYCISVKDGLRIKKEYSSRLVIIEADIN
jgi:hypothetical protein